MASRRLRLRLLAATALVAAATVPVVTLPASGAGDRVRSARRLPRPPAGTGCTRADGGIFAFGSAGFQGAVRSQSNDIIGMAATPSGNGYWMADDDGDVFAAGDATVFGARASSVDDVAAFTARPQGDGYWLATRTGKIESYGKAPAFPGATVKETKRITTVASTASGAGAWMAGLDGGVFTSGDAGFFGSMGGVRLNQPVVGMAPTPSGRGYWLVASDGGIFSFGDAGFFGSTGAIRLNQPVVGMAPTPSGRGYWLVASDGGVFSFGDARFFGSTGRHPAQPAGAGHDRPPRSAGGDARSGPTRLRTRARRASRDPGPARRRPRLAGGDAGRRRRHRPVRQQRPVRLQGRGHRQAARRHSP